MTVPVAKNYPNGVGINAPNTPYFINDNLEELVELLPEQENGQDPIILLSAQLQNNLFVTPENEFNTNVPGAVYKDFFARGEEWRIYIEQGGWKNFTKSLQSVGKMVSTNIMQEYLLLGQVGQEPKCMFGLEKISLHLRDVISMETFFSSLFE